MALTLLASNNASTVLAAGISSSATSLAVNTGTGALFPSPVSGTSYFKLTLLDAATGTITEIMHVIAVSGDIFTVLRGQEGTTARIWSANDIAANMLTAGSLLSMLQINNNLSEIAAVGASAQTAARASIVAAALTGLATQAFNVATATAGSHAVNLTQLNSAITDLNLGSASTRTVGTGTNQIPDMNSFNLNSIQCFRLPTGHIVQVGGGVTVNGGFTQSYQVPFPNQCLALIGTVYGTTGQRLFVATNTSDRTAANMNVVDMNGSGVNVSVGYIAIGR